MLIGAAAVTGIAFVSPVLFASEARTPDNRIPLRDIGSGIGVGDSPQADATSAPVATTTVTTTTATATSSSSSPVPSASATPTKTPTKTPTTAPPVTTTTPQTADTSQERRVLALVNLVRIGSCAPVRIDARITSAAQAHSSDMAERGYFSRVSPEGLDPAARMRAAGYPTPGGENLAKGQRSAEQVMKGWMDSPLHRRNILDCSFTTMGVGVDTRGWYWTQDFGR